MRTARCAEEDFNNDAVDAGDIGAGHQVTALYEIVPAGATGWLPERRYAGNARPARRRIRARRRAGLRQAALQVARRRGVAADRAAGIRGIAAPGAYCRQGTWRSWPRSRRSGRSCAATTISEHISFDDIRRLAGDAPDYWRQEFGRLTRLADRGAGRSGGGRLSGVRGLALAVSERRVRHGVMNETSAATSAPGSSLLPDGTAVITTIHLVLIVLIALAAVAVIVVGARRKRARRQAEMRGRTQCASRRVSNAAAPAPSP